MSDVERSVSKSPRAGGASPAVRESRSKSRSKSRDRSKSRSRSKRRDSRSKSRSRSRYRSRSRSRSRSPRRRRSRSRDRRRSRSRSRDRRRGGGYRNNGYRSGGYGGGGGGRRYGGGGGGGRYGGGGGGRFGGRRRSRTPSDGRRRHDGDREAPPESKVLGIFNLSLNSREETLQDVFGRYGHIEEVTIVYDRKTGRSRGFGFVTFEDVEDAREARDAVSGMEVDGRSVRVDFSVTKRAHTPTPGMYMGRPTR